MKYVLIILILVCNNVLANNIWEEGEGVFAPSAVQNLVVDSKGTIYAASYSNLYRSFDGGDSWTRIKMDNSAVFSKTILNIVCDKKDNIIILNNNGISIVKPNSDNSVYSLWSTNIRDIVGVTENNEIICYNTNGSILVSNTEKTKWSEINLTNESYPYGTFKSIHYDDNYGIIKIHSFYENYYDQNEKVICYNSTDLGKTWLQMDYLPNSELEFKDIRIIDSNYWLYLSDSNTRNWSLWDIDNGLNQELDKDMTDLIFYSFTLDNDIYLVNGSTLHKSTDGGATWTDTSLNVFETINVRYTDAFAIDSLGNYYLGTRYKQIMKYSSETKSWIKLEIDLETNVDRGNGFDFKYKNNKLFATDNWQFIYQSADNGKNWVRIPYPRISYFSGYDIDSNGRIIIADGKYLRYSNDYGKSWTEIDSSIAYNNSGAVKVNFFNDGSVYVSGPTSYYLENIDTLTTQYTIGLKQVTKLDDGKHFGIHSKRAVLANSDFSDYSFIDETIYDYLGNFPKMSSYAVSTDGFVYLATEKGLFVAPGFEDDWNYIGFPEGILSISIDVNDYIYIRFYDDYDTRDSVIYSNDRANSWHPINKQAIGSRMTSFLGFGDGNIVLKDSKVRYGKVPYQKSLIINSTIEKNIWADKNGLVNINVSTLDDDLVEDATVIVYKSWENKYDTLLTDQNGMAQLEVNKDLFKSNINTEHEFYIWAIKDGFQTSKIYTQIMEYNSQMKDSELVHINSNNKYYVCKVDSTVTYNMSIYNDNNEAIEGKFKVENFLNNQIEVFENLGEGFGTYTFKIPSNIPLGMYKLSFTGETIDEESVTSPFETYIIVTDTIYELTYVSVEEEYTQDIVKIFPNPANEILHISCSDLSVQVQSIKILDIQGKTVKQLLINSNIKDIELNTSELPAGFYNIVLETQNNTVFNQVIIE